MTRSSSKHIIISSAAVAVLSFGHLSANAQAPAKDSVMRTNTIEVIQSYRPEVKQAPKPEFVPGLPPVDTSRPRLSYTVPPQMLYFSFHSTPLKPLALGKDSTDLPFPNYIKMGGGNLSTVYLDAGIGSLKGENYSSAIHLRHISQAGTISDQKTALSGVEAEGWLNTGKNNYHVGLNGLRNQYSFYGYDHDNYKLTTDSVKQVFTGVRVMADMSSALERGRRFVYSPGISLGVYGDRFKSTETSFIVNVPMGQAIDSNLSYQVDVRASYANLSTNGTSSQNFQAQIKPGVRYTRGIFEGYVGLYPTFSTSIAYLLPDVKVAVRIPNSQFIISGGWQEHLLQNTYEALTARNPWLLASNTNGFKETQTHKKEVYGDIQSNIGDHFSFSGRFSWLEWDNLPVFMNVPKAEMYFYNLATTQQGRTKAVGVQANIRYHIANTFSVGLTANWMNYYEKPYAQVWNEPNAQFKADLVFHPMSQLTVTAYSLLLDGIHAKDSVTGNDLKMNAILDVGAGAEYAFIPKLSAFLNVNNLLNNRNERWYGYPSYGFNIYGGLRLKF